MVLTIDEYTIDPALLEVFTKNGYFIELPCCYVTGELDKNRGHYYLYQKQTLFNFLSDFPFGRRPIGEVVLDKTKKKGKKLVKVYDNKFVKEAEMLAIELVKTFGGKSVVVLEKNFIFC